MQWTHALFYFPSTLLSRLPHKSLSSSIHAPSQSQFSPSAIWKRQTPLKMKPVTLPHPPPPQPPPLLLGFWASMLYRGPARIRRFRKSPQRAAPPTIRWMKQMAMGVRSSRKGIVIAMAASIRCIAVWGGGIGANGCRRYASQGRSQEFGLGHSPHRRWRLERTM